MNDEKLKKKLDKWLSERQNLKVDYNIIKATGPCLSDAAIDMQTSEDLLITEYGRTLDRAITTPGRNTLYALLHSPLQDPEGIYSRRALIESLMSDKKLSAGIMKLLWKARFSPKYSVNHVLFERPAALFTREKLALLLLTFVFLVITIPLLFSQLAVYSILLFLIISFLIFARNISIYNSYIPGLINLSVHYYTATKIISLFSSRDIPDPHIQALEDSLNPVKGILPPLKILAAGSMLSEDPFQLMLFMLKNIFCIDLIAFDKAIKILDSRRTDLINFYCRYGIIDALTALSVKLDNENAGYCRAEFHSEMRISAEGLYHPLLRDPVNNSISINRGIILTGSNMAGKSTFLRTIGLNTVLSQTIGYCHAEGFRLPILNVVSIINKKDDLNSGESFYYFEAKRISEMIGMEKTGNYLFLIDELLSGTNSLERVSASVAIIKHLLTMQHIIFAAATHDITIAAELHSNCDCYYFSDYIKEKRMSFDYKLKPGIIKTTNAIRMLEILGLPESVIVMSKKLLNNK